MPDDDIKGAYDVWAPQYDSDGNATRDLDAHVLQSAGLDLTGATVLELGCGTGKNTAWLAEQADSVIAMDFSTQMIALAQQRVHSPSVQWLQQDVQTRWPVGDATVDAVVVNLVLEHIKDLSAVFAEAARTLKRGGQFFLCELHPYRQLRGGQAHFVEIATGRLVYVPAFLHLTSDYINTGIANGFRVVHLGEWRDVQADSLAVPRLLSVLFQRTDSRG